ncbi:hypothetical protein K503DRAFT_133757 [Rhizopogon vinicolor AM-OR11-026]|uniref:Uncharacterized protein n=1 Tax=Rhizopogon vinicolor AM-OR11-026 TaxID=1314800 RepID=A0A1B7N1R7_9AGAM|nr:hypothetical protein K503DRAFT_133757 [Rhizopogon vinicolor AM-OR11-026]
MQSSGADTNHQRPDNFDNNFDALIDLLASDDIHDIVVAPSGPSHSSRVHLRDASGKLDFDKIRLMFVKQNLGTGVSDDTAQTHGLLAQRESDLQDALSGGDLSRSVSPSSQFLSAGRVRNHVCPRPILLHHWINMFKICTHKHRSL